MSLCIIAPLRVIGPARRHSTRSRGHFGQIDAELIDHNGCVERQLEQGHDLLVAQKLRHAEKALQHTTADAEPPRALATVQQRGLFGENLRSEEHTSELQSRE